MVYNYGEDFLKCFHLDHCQDCRDKAAALRPRLTVEGIAKAIAGGALGGNGGTTVPPEVIAVGCMRLAQAVLDYIKEGG